MMLPAVVALTELVDTAKLAAVALAATVTEDGTLAAGFASESDTIAPPAGAGAVKFTVPVADCPPITDAGATLTEFNAGVVTVGL